MKDRKLLSVIWTSLSAEAMFEVIECSSSHSDWSTLQVAFSDSSASRTHQLREELLSLRRGAQSVEEYGQKFKGLCDQLSAINRTVDDSDKGHWFLGGLGTLYTSFSDTRLALTPMPMFRDLLHQAKQFESMLRAMDAPPTSLAAFSAEQGRTSNEQHLSGGQNSSSDFAFWRSFGSSSLHTTLPNMSWGALCRQVSPILNARNAIHSAHLAEAFKASCSVAPPASDWYLDSGASAHMTNQQSVLDSCAPYSGNGSAIVGNGNSLSISHIGSSKLTNDVQLLDVLVVPHITKNLLSISKLTTDYLVDVLFSDKSFVIQNRVTKSILAQGRRDKVLYLLDRGVPALVAALRGTTLKASFSLWHLRQGHVPFHVISLLNKLGHLSISSLLPDPSVCPSCHLGPAPIATPDGYEYYVVFVDDFSRFSWIYPVMEALNLLMPMFEFMSANGIHHHLSCPYTPQQNGRAERKHRHVTKTGLSMMFHSHAPASFGFDAFVAALISFPLGVTLAFFLGYNSTYKGFRCLDPASNQVFITRHAQFDKTLFPFPSESSSSSPSNLDIVSFRDGASLLSASAGPTPSVPTPSTLRPPLRHPSALLDDEESEVLYQSELSAHPEHVAQLQPEQPTPPATEPAAQVAPPATETAAQVAPPVQHPMVTRARAGIYKRRYPVDLSYTTLLSALVASLQPRGIKSVAKSPAWSSTMQEEIDSIHAHDTWDLMPRPPDTNIVGNDQSLLQRFISQTHKEFSIKDLSRLNYFLGLEVSYSNDGLFIGEVLVRDGSPFRDPTGALQYLIITRPDLSYAVNLVSQFLQSPTDDHFQALKRIILQNHVAHKRAKHIDLDYHFFGNLWLQENSLPSLFH
ncbi:hypothetical protein SASPL_143266 [Salvia splendens]|uniref:Integrase catalytic domain-containing protein n=1 Tax=Salvia splendens TaxID=180675 RepID=A0A8X8WLH8_SALSN|nr:hypothetical protein SASPL_143266 [Salvia splendens]